MSIGLCDKQGVIDLALRERVFGTVGEMSPTSRWMARPDTATVLQTRQYAPEESMEKRRRQKSNSLQQSQ